VEELDKREVERLGAEVLLEDLKHKRLEQERVVDRDHLDLGVAVPARLPAAQHRRVHDVVGDQEKRLQLRQRRGIHM
jgi:hypothetical protein